MTQLLPLFKRTLTDGFLCFMHPVSLSSTEDPIYQKMLWLISSDPTNLSYAQFRVKHHGALETMKDRIGSSTTQRISYYPPNLPQKFSKYYAKYKWYIVSPKTLHTNYHISPVLVNYQELQVVHYNDFLHISKLYYSLYRHAIMSYHRLSIRTKHVST